jgi:thiamine kinase-like enzyme
VETADPRAVLILPEILAALPGAGADGASVQITAFAAGRACNQVLRADTPDGRFVIRRRYSPVVRPASHPDTERECHRFAAQLGLAPQLIATAPDGSWMIMEYVDGEPWAATRLLSRSGALSLGERLSVLHQSAPPASVPRMDASAIARAYMALVGHDEALLRHVVRLAAAISERSQRWCVNHGDLQASNLLGPAPVLVDWEYAQLADPTYDIACLLEYYPGLSVHADALMIAAGLDRAGDRALLDLQRALFGLFNNLWSAANAV